MNVDMKSVLTDDRALRAALKGMRDLPQPSGLTTSLRVVASRERHRAAERRSWAAFGSAWAGRVRLTVQNLMRPFAVPFAGGVFSAVALFSVWVVPAYPVLAYDGVDVPTSLSTLASIKSASRVGMENADIVVDIVIDGQGRMIDYAVVQGTLDSQTKRELQATLMYAEFNPATAFIESRVLIENSPSCRCPPWHSTQCFLKIGTT
jgi:hypothetical protein